jgi:hypothetical protein
MGSRPSNNPRAGRLSPPSGSRLPDSQPVLCRSLVAGIEIIGRWRSSVKQEPEITYGYCVVPDCDSDRPEAVAADAGCWLARRRVRTPRRQPAPGAARGVGPDPVREPPLGHLRIRRSRSAREGSSVDVRRVAIRMHQNRGCRRGCHKALSVRPPLAKCQIRRVGRLGLEPRTYGLTGRGRSRAPQGSAAGKQRLGLRRSSRRFAWLRSHWAPNLGSRNAT